MATTSAPAGTSSRRRSGVLRGIVLLLVIGVWLGVGAVGGPAQGDLAGLQENDQAAFLPTDAESTRAADAAEEFEEDSGLPGFVVVVDVDRTDLEAEQLASAETFAQDIGSLDLGAGLSTGDVFLGPATVVPSEDNRAALIAFSLDGDLANEPHGPDDDAIVQLVVDAVRAAAPEAFQAVGAQAWVTGPAGYVADLSEAFGGIDTVLLLVAFAAVLVILFCVYRAPLIPFIVLAAPLFALCASALVVRYLAQNDLIQLNGQAQGIMSILAVGAATDYALLLVARYREELTRIENPVAALRRAWRRCVEPVLASAGTVTAGLLCLLLSDLASNAALGPVGTVAIGSSVLAAMTLLPALLVVAGRRSRGVFWPRQPQYHSHAAAAGGTGPGVDVRPSTAGSGQAQSARHSRVARNHRPVWDRVADRVVQKARLAWMLTAAVLLVAAAFVTTFQADGTGQADNFLTAVDSVAGDEALTEHFTAGQAQPVIVITAADTAEQVVAELEQVSGIDAVNILADEDGEPVVVGDRVQVQAITSAVSESSEGQDAAAQVRGAAQDIDPEALIGGASADLLDARLTADRDLRVIIPVVLSVILVMLILLLRSVLAPVLLLIVNVLSFAATMGISAVVFNHVFGFPGADPAVPLFGFIFLVALSIDYSIFLMTRVREEALEHGTRRGVHSGLAVTGGVITSAGLVLAATFSALSVIPLLFMAQIAFIVAVGVLLDTFVVRTILVPGLMHDIGRPVWWPRHRHYPRDEGSAA